MKTERVAAGPSPGGSARALRATACALLLSLAAPGLAWAADLPTHRLFHVRLDATATQGPVSGRLLLFAAEAKGAEAAAKKATGGKDATVTRVDASAFHPGRTRVAARDVSGWAGGAVVDIDADRIAFPAGYSQLPAGDYLVQAVLDRNHDYNYGGRGAGDLVSPVVRVHLPTGRIPTVVLDRMLPARDPWSLPSGAPRARVEALAAARPHARPIDFDSPALGAFWGRTITMRGWVLTPPGYDSQPGARYPTVYFTHGFGGNRDRLLGTLADVYQAMARGAMPPMIWVFLDESSATGTHEFADSVNNGPWGRALTRELIPHLESQYRMDGRASGRFLNGHSSGGWATLWLQTRYPKIFGGTWSTSPDPSDFHDFTGIDLYAPHANAYHRPDGTAYPLVRDKGRVIGTFEQFARLERVLGPYGGQLASFEWVFSPRGADGRPVPLFDRDTGAVDPAVVAYWGEHYDIARRLRQHWPELRDDLDGKIHLYVGTADTFYLDGAAHRLQAVLEQLGAHADIRFLPGKTHFDLYGRGKDDRALLKDIAWQMYAIARPGSTLKRAGAP